MGKYFIFIYLKNNSKYYNINIHFSNENPNAV